MIEKYKKMLARKERLIEEYIQEKNSIDGFISSVNEVKYNVLYTEIQLLKSIIEDLKELTLGEKI